MKMKRIMGSALFAVFFAPIAQADSIIKIPLSETASPDVQFDGNNFSTVNDGDAATTGDQDTKVDFVGFLSFLNDINTATASFSLSNVKADGAPTDAGVVVQPTTGGNFSLYDQFNTLLLSGTLTAGALVGGNSDTGTFFNTTVATYTSGSLLAYITPMPASISFALAGILSGVDTAGLAISNNTLTPFVADASALLTGNSTGVPEPLSLSLLFSGIVGLGISRKRAL